MSMICIPVPHLEADQTVAIEVTIDGRTRAMNYRVETLPWPEHHGVDDQIDALRRFIRAHEPEWQLVQIGPPDSGVVAVTFRRMVVPLTNPESAPA